MCSAPSSTRVRYALLLAAVLGGIALFGVAMLPATSGTMIPDSGYDYPLPASGRLFGGSHALASSLPAGCTSGDSDVFNKDVLVDSEQSYCGHLNDYGGNVTVLGHVGGDVQVIHGNIAISGEVDGRVLAIGGDISLLPGAHIGGDVQVIGGDITQAPDVTIGGQIIRGVSPDQLSPPNITTFIPVRLDWADVIFWAFAGLVIALFLPSQLVHVRQIARKQPVGSIFLGLLAYIVGVLAAIVLVFTCLGIPLALAIGVVLWGGSIFGTAALGQWLGSALVPGANGYKRFPFVLATILGVTLLAIASTAPVVGGVIRVVVSSAGLGAVLLTIMTMRNPTPTRARTLV